MLASGLLGPLDFTVAQSLEVGLVGHHCQGSEDKHDWDIHPQHQAGPQVGQVADLSGGFHQWQRGNDGQAAVQDLVERESQRC